MNIIWKKDIEKLDIKEKDGVTWFSFPRLEQTGIVLQAFSTRLGGCSKGFLESMNLGFSRGDDPEAVMENYRRISGAVGFPLDSIVTSDQTHTYEPPCGGKGRLRKRYYEASGFYRC